MNHVITILAPLMLLAAAPVNARTITACASAAANCDFVGNDSIQKAVDSAANGDVIHLRAGRFVPNASRDIPYQDVAIRGYVVIDGKQLTVEAEPGAVIDGGPGIPSSAFVLRNAQVDFRNLDIRDFRYAVQEDKIYDGHGIFAIDSRVRLRDVRLEKLIKMSLTGRGDTLIDADRVQIINGHVGLWLEESAHAHLTNTRIENGDSAAVAAYGNASATLVNSIVSGNKDDGLYAKGQSSIVATNSIISGNAPFALNAEEGGRIRVVHSVLHGNAKSINAKAPKGQLVLGDGIATFDPLLDENGVPRSGSPLAGKTDPLLNRPIGLMVRP